MKVSCAQMNMKLPQSAADVDYNFQHAQELIRGAVEKDHPDVVVLPETWNVGFFPEENLADYCDRDGERIRKEFGALAAELGVNIVAGSIGNVKNGRPYNSAFVFDRKGECVYTYDKTHLFSPMGEGEAFEAGDTYSVFELDGVRCGLLICYDVRFPELTRSLTLQGVDVFFIVSQWPAIRAQHLDVLTQARAIENQMFLALCNSTGTAYDTVYGGGSQIIDPWGVKLVQAGKDEETITAELDLSVIEGIRSSINIFRHLRPNLYHIV